MKYYTVIVVKIDAFESQIVNERHFGNYEDAEEFSRNVPQEPVNVLPKILRVVLVMILLTTRVIPSSQMYMDISILQVLTSLEMIYMRSVRVLYLGIRRMQTGLMIVQSIW